MKLNVFVMSVMVFLLSGYFSLAQTQNWSNPNTWGGSVPVAGQDVVIPMGKKIILDVSPPPLGDVVIMGTLTFKDMDVNFTAGTIMVDNGLLEIGSEDNLFQNNATITLTGEIGSQTGHNSRFLMPMNGGTIEFHGISATYLDWSQINQNVYKGETSLLLKDPPTGWKAGDQIVIASSSFDPREAEQLTITSISGNTVNFSPALQFDHFGEIQNYGGMVLDERAEVGLLSRNILIQGGPDSENLKMGGHVMIMPGANARIEGTEFFHMGQLGQEARYSLHWHFTGDKPDNYARHNSIHHSFHRGIVVHQTDNLTIEWNVAYDINSHCYVPSEDGVETGNKFYYNLGILTKRIDVEDFAFPKEEGNRSTQSEHRPGTFWLKNPLNELVGNHAAGAYEGMGFFYDRRHTDYHTGQIINAITDPIVFRDNVAHSNFGQTGGNDVYGPLTRGYGIFGDNRAEGERIYENFTVYKNSLSGTWIEGPNIIIRNSISADNNTGHMLMQSKLENSVIVGQSANTLGGEAPTQGVYHVSGAIQLIGHGGPKRPQIENVSIIDQRYGAIVMATQNTLSNSYVSNLKQENVYQPFWFRYVDAGGAFIDKDGSLTGHGPSLVVSQQSDLITMDCIEKPDWKGYVCPSDQYNVIYFTKFDRNEPEFPNLTLLSAKGNIGLVGARLGSGSRGGERYTYLFTNTEFDTYNDFPWPSEFEVAMELKQNTWDMVKLKSIAPDVKVSAGKHDDENKIAIPAVNSLAELQSSMFTAYFYNSKSMELHLKFVHDNSLVTQTLTVNHSGGVPSTEGAAVLPIEIYPNPVTDGFVNFNIATLITEDMYFSLFDASGRIVQTGSLIEESKIIYIKSLAAGLYVLRISNPDKVIAQAKLVVE